MQALKRSVRLAVLIWLLLPLPMNFECGLRAQPASQSSSTQSQNNPHPNATRVKGGSQDNAARWYDLFLNHPTEWLLVLFNGLLALYTYRLFTATSGLFTETAGLRQAAEEQRADLLRSVKASEQSAAIARDALVMTERAFVFLEDFDIDFSAHPRGGQSVEFGFLTIKPRWRNNGNTPTRNMTICVNWTHFPGDLAEDFSYAYDAPPFPMFLAPKASEWSEAITIPGNVATDALKERSRIFIWGRVEYEDVFADTTRHFTQWCYRLVFLSADPVRTPVRTQLLAFGRYNNSDEDARVLRRGGAEVR